MSGTIFGYFDDASQTKPTFDPGLDVLCPFCLKQLSRPLRTTSFLAIGDNRSFFYRAHRDCAENATPEQEMEVESSVVDSRMGAPAHTSPQGGGRE